jgi:hypothetical protein
MDQYLGICLGIKSMSLLLQFLFDLGKVIYLPIEYYRHSLVFVVDRLFPCIEINDAQSPMPKGNAAFDILPFVIGPPLP